MKLEVLLFGLSQALKLRARTSEAMRAHLRGRKLVVQIRVMDGAIGRYFVFDSGKVRSRKGLHSKPDVSMVFASAKVAVGLLAPPMSNQAQIDAAKNFQIRFEGPDELVSFWTETLSLAMAGDVECGIEVGDGVHRFVNDTNGGPVFVYVKDGEILRITPIDFDGSDAKPWTIEARGRTFTPPRKTTLAPYGYVSKSLVYAPNRLLHPMKRVDFDADGDRHPDTRGSSGYERISWDEALDLVASEIQRVRRERGPGAIFSSHGSHHSWGNIGYYLSAHRRFFNTIGATRLSMNPDSWEGWYWGAAHHWGHTLRLGAAESYGTVEDLLKECELIVFWSSDPEATSGVYGGMEGTVRRQWLRDLGIECVHIDPYLNHTAALLEGKWLAPRPTTSVALAHAIAYVWLTDELHDADYIRERTTGFDAWQAYLLGDSDGTAKTPEWQEPETGVPAREVRALARLWASKKTYLACGGPGGNVGGACRSATGTEWARSMVYLMAMRGLGKPGVNFGNLQVGTPVDFQFFFPGYAEGGMSGDLEGTALAVNMYQRMPQMPTMNTVLQKVPRLALP